MSLFWIKKFCSVFFFFIYFFLYSIQFNFNTKQKTLLIIHQAKAMVVKFKNATENLIVMKRSRAGYKTREETNPYHKWDSPHTKHQNKLAGKTIERNDGGKQKKINKELCCMCKYNFIFFFLHIHVDKFIINYEIAILIRFTIVI